MNRLHAFLLLVLYAAFSGMTFFPGPVSLESSAEGTEKEAIGALCKEHHESRALKVPARRHLYRAPGIPGDVPVTGSSLHQTGSSGFTVPYYILYCVYRL